MYVGILRVHDASRCASLRKILKDPVTDPKTIAGATTYKKKTPLSFDIGKTTVLHTASLRLCSFFARLFCSNVGTIMLYVRTIMLCQLRRCSARHLRNSQKLFNFLRQAPSCRMSSAKGHRQRKGRKKSGKQVKVPISAEFEQKDVMLHLFSQGCP